jgi:hypothetical protein
MENFYTYLWLREDGTPYYVGKGVNHRGFTSAMHRLPCPSDKSRIIIQEWLSEIDAYEAEKFLIAYYGRKDLSEGCLRNLTNGGDQPPSRKGAKHTEASNQKNREAHLGFRHSDKSKARIGVAAIGNTYAKGNTNRRGLVHSESARVKMSLAKKGKPSPFKGKRHTEESKLKISMSKKGF